MTKSEMFFGVRLVEMAAMKIDHLSEGGHDNLVFAILMPVGMQGCIPIDHLWPRSSAQSFAASKICTGLTNAAETQHGQLSLNRAMDPGNSKGSSARRRWCGMIALIHGEGA